MKFRITREACCSQDDQIGPLEMVYDLDDEATLRQLVEAIEASRFLQFSSTHQVLVGRVGNTDLVRALGPSLLRRCPPEYLAQPDTKASEYVGGAELHFRFVVE